MKAIQLRAYQRKALDAIQNGLNNNQKTMIVEMPTGCGKSIIVAKTIEMISKSNRGNILIITSSTLLKQQTKDILFKDFNELIQMNNSHIEMENIQKIVKHANEYINNYQVFIFYDVPISKYIYDSLLCRDKTNIIFSASSESANSFFNLEDVVFQYSYKDAINDGILTPAMNPSVFEPAVELFSKQLLEMFGYTQYNLNEKAEDHVWDMLVEKDNRKIWVEYKTYKSQVVSPSAASSLLNTIVMKKTKQSISHTDVILLLVFSTIPSFQKDEIYKRYRIIVWDIENLVFYSKNNPILLKQLSQITYFPIDYIEGQPSREAESSGLMVILDEEQIYNEAEKETNETILLIDRLKSCKYGKKYSNEYENICEEIIRNLFEASYFNRLTSQHKTKDEHFRMDLIGSLKINQSNEESMHPLWQMLVHHYNSHFVVFEFKNYSKEIDQNLVYITEKYLFDAALRNVAIIISRKGFSPSAKFAAEGCLKEHGKLILNITDEDLIKMIKMKNVKAADYLLEQLEEFLMGISK